MKLTIYAGDERGARPLSDGDSVPASAALRFRVQTSTPCDLTLLSVDDSGQVSRIYGPARTQGARALPGGGVLDGRPGAERFFAVCAPEPIQGLEERVKKAGVRGNQPLSDLPRGSTQSSLLLEKGP